MHLNKFFYNVLICITQNLTYFDLLLRCTENKFDTNYFKDRVSCVLLLLSELMKSDLRKMNLNLIINIIVSFYTYFIYFLILIQSF